MKLLHTSDWHLGKNLDGKERFKEQEMILNDVVNIVKEKNIDVVIIAGDIYDTYNPPVKAEKLFLNTLKEITKSNETIVIAIAGNHDSPEKLTAANSLAKEHGIYIFGTIHDTIEETTYGNFEIKMLNKGVLEIKKNGQTVICGILPYPSEKRINEIISDFFDEKEEQKDYSQKIYEMFNNINKYYRDDTINIAVSHLYIIGGEETESERVINVGGSLGVRKKHLPQKSQYTALGHFHKPQIISKSSNAYYSGSLLQYSKNESNYSKLVKIVNLEPGKDADIENYYLNNYKPIEIFKCKSISQAITKCEENKGKSIWSYFEIDTDRVLNQSEIKEMYELIPDIVEIRPVFNSIEEVDREKLLKKESINDLFIEYYKKTYESEPELEVIEMFEKIASKFDEK